MEKQSSLFINGNSIALILVLAIVICFIFISCSNSEKIIEDNAYTQLLQAVTAGRASTHRWFYFTEDGFKETDIPRNAPETQKKPWTEAIRITSSAFIDDTAYFSVNKLGLLICPEASGHQGNGIASETMLIKNLELFSAATVGNLFCVDDTPVFNLYTNSIFDTATQNTAQTQKNNPFLIQFLPSTYEFVPLLSQNSFETFGIFEDTNMAYPELADNTEIRELYFDDENWNVLLKSNSSQRTGFFALSFYASEPITTFGTVEISDIADSLPATKNLFIQDISINDYRELTRPHSASTLPRRITELLEPIPSRVSYYLDHITDSGKTMIQYVHSAQGDRSLQGYSLNLEHCSIAVFEDGTICFAGALPLKGVIDGGKTISFKLPNLGAGYAYGYMALSGSTLIVSWEETSFFETGRSGFLAVDLEQVLYQ